MPDALSDHAESARERLAQLADLRRAHLASAAHLANDVRRAVKVAQNAEIPLAEIARLLDMDRSTLYRTYLDGGSGGS